VFYAEVLPKYIDKVFYTENYLHILTYSLYHDPIFYQDGNV